MWVKANDTIDTNQQAAQYIGESQSGSIPLEVIPLEDFSLELEAILLENIIPLTGIPRRQGVPLGAISLGGLITLEGILMDVSFGVTNPFDSASQSKIFSCLWGIKHMFTAKNPTTLPKTPCCLLSIMPSQPRHTSITRRQPPQRGPPSDAPTTIPLAEARADARVSSQVLLAILLPHLLVLDVSLAANVSLRLLRE